MKMIQGAAVLLAALQLLTPAALAAETEEMMAPATELSVPAAEAEAGGDWSLLLVNPWTALPEGYGIELASLANGLRVDKRIYGDLQAMLDDCWKAGLRPLVCSAYRTQAVQTRLYHNKIARLQAAGVSAELAPAEAARWVAAPGTSEHQTGLALDIVSMSYQLLNERQARTAEQLWLMEHCWEYGFILRYPQEKTAVTGIGYEPWHYRYVGKEAAAAMRQSGLCLEEYLAAMEAEAVPAPPPVAADDAIAVEQVVQELPQEA